MLHAGVGCIQLCPELSKKAGFATLNRRAEMRETLFVILVGLVSKVEDLTRECLFSTCYSGN